MTTWRVIVPFLALVAAPGARADDAAAIQAVYRDWMVPRAVELVADSARLTRVMEDYCGAPTQDAEAALNRARRSWNASLVDWDRVSAVAIGPVLDYRMQGKLDFTPTRPRMIRKAIKDAPASAADMDRIGTPAKGFPALEWLLWTKPIQPASPECRYAVQVAREIEREAQFMEKTFREAAAAKIDAADAKKALSEFVNQWVGGLDRLRWADMEKPARKAITTGRNGPPEYPRRASGATVVSWAAR